MTSELTPARPYSSRAKRALELADEEALDLGDEFIGSEHLLLGLMADRTSPAAQILGKLGVTTNDVHTLLAAVRRAV